MSYTHTSIEINFLTLEIQLIFKQLDA